MWPRVVCCKMAGTWLTRPTGSYCPRRLWKPEELTNCGTKVADVLDKFFSRQTFMGIHLKCWCIYLQLLWLHNAHHFKVLLLRQPFGCNLKGEYWDPQFGGLGSVSGLGFEQIESPITTSQCLSVQSIALSAAVWPKFKCQVMAFQFDPRFGG